MQHFVIRIALTLIAFLAPVLSSNCGATTPIRLVIEPPHAEHRVAPQLFGINTLFFQETVPVLSSATFRESLRALAPGLLRYPAGTAGENYLWKSNSIARPDWYPGRSNSATDSDTTQFLRLVQDYSTTPILLINYRHFANLPDTAAGHANALDWVKFANGPLQANVQLWEYGNETYFRELEVDPEHYGKSYVDFRRALKAHDPNLNLGLVMAHFWNAGPAVEDRYNERVISQLDAPPDFVILHFYPVITTESLARQGMGIRNKIRWFRLGLQRHNLDPDIPILVTEWNASSKDSTLRGQSIGHLICVAQGLLELHASRVHSANFWPLQSAGKGLMKPGSFHLQPAGEMFAWMNRLLRGRRSMPLKLSSTPQHLEVAGFRHSNSSGSLVLAINRSSEATETLHIKPYPPGEAPVKVTQISSTDVGPDINSLNFSVTTFDALVTGTGATVVALPPLSITALHINEPVMAPPEICRSTTGLGS